MKKLFRVYSGRSRSRRGRIFLDRLKPKETDLIVDLGSEDGAHLASIIPYRKNVYLADIDQEAMDRGKAKFGFGNTLLLDETGIVPVADQHFDVVFCSSVIEHVTVDKQDIGSYATNAAFHKVSIERQRKFAQEIRRIGKKYFVQTPNRYFWIESHSWLPGCLVLLPRRLQQMILNATNRFWPKKAHLDFNLLTPKLMAELFPDAEIVVERSMGLVKSIMAIKG